MLDPDTGMPEIPEFHYWDVKKTTYGFSDVRLMRRRRWWTDEEIDTRSFYTSEISPATLRECAYEILERRAMRARVEENKGLYTQYPPNELKG